jgi:nucleoside-diphosphate-sugar epimerase
MDIEIEIVPDEQRLRPDRSEVEQLRCCNSKLCEFTDWEPRFSLEAGLKETIEWTEANLKIFKYDRYNI